MLVQIAALVLFPPMTLKQIQLSLPIILIFLLYNANIEVRSQYAEQYYKLGLNYQRSGKMIKAEEEFIKALQVDPTYIAALENLGFLYLERGDHKRAGNCFSAAKESYQYSAKAWYGWAFVQEIETNIEEAIYGYQYVLKLNPIFTEAYWRLGKIYKERNESAQAKKYLQCALKIYPDNEILRGLFSEIEK